MESDVFEQLHEAKIINMEEYLYRKAILGILNRTELSEEIKRYPVAGHARPELRVIYSKNREKDKIDELSDHLEEEISEAKVVDIKDHLKIKLTLEILKNIKSF